MLDTQGCQIANKNRKEFLSLIGFDFEIEAAKGTKLYTTCKRELTDFSSQYGVMLLGHNHGRLTRVASDLLTSNQPVMVQPFTPKWVDRLAQSLIKVMPNDDYKHVQFTNSGAETVEAAFKLARSCTGRRHILATQNGFHGKTEGAVKATGKAVYREPFGIEVHNTSHVEYGNLEALEQALKTLDYAAFIVEPIQGEAGMVLPPEGYLKKAEALCNATNTLFILDEIQTGLGRTGSLFCAEAQNLSPDMLLLSKGLSGGLVPIGALITKQSVWTKDFGLFHSSTFSNNNLASRIALELLDQLLENDSLIIREAKEKGIYLKNELNKLVDAYPLAFDKVNGQGLMLGLKLQPWNGDRFYLMSYSSSVGFSVPIVSGYLLNAHDVVCLPTLSSSDVLRIQPPLTVSYEDIDHLINALNDVGNIIQTRCYEKLILRIEKSPLVKKDDIKKIGRLKNFNEQDEEDVKINTSCTLDSDRCLGTFAFFLHPTDNDSLYGQVALGNVDLSHSEFEVMSQWLKSVSDWSKDLMECGTVYAVPRLYSKNGGYVQGYIISSLLKPSELLRLRPVERKQLFDSYFSVIEGLNVDVVGLGAYTSVISKAGMELLDRNQIITTGNSLTAISCSQSLINIANQSGRPIHDRTVAIVGAYGSVGRLSAIDIACHAKGLVLIGNPFNRNAVQTLKKLAGEIYQQLIFGETGSSSPIVRALRDRIPGFNVHVATPSFSKLENQTVLFDELTKLLSASGLPESEHPIVLDVKVAKYLEKVDAMISATSFGRGFIDQNECKPGMIICDAAQPPDLKGSVGRGDIFVYSGGEIELPDSNFRFGAQNINGIETGRVLACLGETITLTMAGIRENRSIGSQPSYLQSRHLYDIAISNGFSLPKFDIGSLQELQSNKIAQ